MHQVDFIHDTAVAIALGLTVDLELMHLEWLHSTRGLAAEALDDLDELLSLSKVDMRRRHELVEGWVQRIDVGRSGVAGAPFTLRSAAAYVSALSWLEIECLGLLRGGRSMARLLRALHSADVLFDRPAWLPAPWRGRSLNAEETAAFEPTLEDLEELLEAVQHARSDAAAAQP